MEIEGREIEGRVFSMYSKIVLFHVFISLFILVSIVYELRVVYT